MKKTILILSFLISILFSSCSVYEDVYFHADGSVKYQLSFDASKMLEIPGMSQEMPTDSTFSMIDKIKEDSLTFSKIDKSDLENLSLLFINIKSDTVNKKLRIMLTGDFKDAESLNKTLISINKTNDKEKSESSQISGTPFSRNTFSSLKLPSQYSWDKTTMSRIVDMTLFETNEEKSEDTIGSAMEQLFNEGRMIVRYHFPEKVLKISDPEALMTQDGKTVVVEYPIVQFTKSSEKMNIKISVK